MLIDSFLFFNEIDLLKVRLQYLGPYVDQFLIIEGKCDFSGRPRELVLTSDIVSALPFSHKIKIGVWSPHFLKLKLLFPLARITRYRKILWGIQNQQRDHLLSLLHEYNKSDLVLFGDLDEIPNKQDIMLGNLDLHFKDSEVITFSQSYFYYNVFTYIDLPWSGTVCTQLQNLFRSSPSLLRKKRSTFAHVISGWHFSYFASPEGIMKKVSTISTVEKLNSFDKMTVEDVSNKINSALDLYDREDHCIINLNQSNIPDDLLMIIQKYLPNQSLKKLN
jgi:beta-1,4-mannosyl-glycoprotein beta-1,4-N-acetylglucosaminyltransferase